MPAHDLQSIIDTAFETAQNTTLEKSHQSKAKEAIADVFNALETGKLAVCEKVQGSWQVNQWIKKAILLHFKLTPSTCMPGEINNFFDKVPMRFQNTTADEFQAQNIRVVPYASVRAGTFIGPNTVLMPSFVNIGAYVGEGCMIDTWATVGSCAHIGKNVHLSGGTGIGGVLEPLQAQPTIIEDNCFIGARSEIVEGVIVEEGSVISMGVFIGQSTKIYHRAKDEVLQGVVPAGSVVVPGSLPGKDGKYALNCAVIVKTVDEQTKNKVGVNQILREAVYG